MVLTGAVASGVSAVKTMLSELLMSGQKPASQALMGQNEENQAENRQK